MKYFSLFSGIGGFELGIQRAFDNRPTGSQEQADTLDKVGSDTSQGDTWQFATCIGYSEIDKYAIKTYEEHFDHDNYGDATKIDPRELPDFDLLVGGFPCQAFSVAGKRLGFDDTRGTLFFDIARVLAEKRPRHLVLENVKGLLSHDSGKTFQTIVGVLTDLGYFVEWQVLNSKDFGVPQNRERIFIVGHLRGQARPQVFPISRESNPYSTESKSAEAAVARTLTGGGNSGGNHSDMTILAHYGHTDKPPVEMNISPTLKAQSHGHEPMILQKSADYRKDGSLREFTDYSPTLRAEMGDNHPMVALTERRTDEARAIRREMMKQGKDWSPRRGKELVPREDGMGNTLTANQSKEHFLTDGMCIRRLTPTECERLQGFPDNWTVGSDTQRYKQCGNAVTVNVVEAVMSRLL